MKFDLWVKGGKVVLPEKGLFELDIGISRGKVIGLLKPGERLESKNVLNADEQIVIPGVIDAHTHLTMGPGDSGYETETRSAAVGGVTSTISYLLDAGDLQKIIEKEIGIGQCCACIDFGLHPCIVTEDQLAVLPQIARRYGTPSFKIFMSFRKDEGAYLGIPGSDDGFLFKLFQVAATMPGAVPCVHAENIELIWQLMPEAKKQGDGSLCDWDRARPDFAEAEATQRALYFAEKADSRLYIVHVTCREALEMIRRAKKRRPGMIFAETCPHYLTMTCESAPFPEGKVNPPLRYPADVESLWEGVADGSIDVVGSDHVPRQLKLKEGGIWKASAGFPGVASLLPVFLAEGVRRHLPLELLVNKITSAPAKIFGLAPAKGSLMPGSDADLVVLDANSEATLNAKSMRSYSDYTPFEGWKSNYTPVVTLLRGRVLVENGEYLHEPGIGIYLKRNK